jgi:hypothetical protein
MYDSKRIADFYEATEKKDMSNKELHDAFRSWTRKQKQLKKIQNINPRNSSQYRSQIETPKSRKKGDNT